jgi:hypothetical protein
MADVESCKRPNCPDPPVDERGPYAGLCATHRAEQQQLRAGGQSAAPRGGELAGSSESLHGRIKRLGDAAKKVDRAQARAADAGKKLADARGEYARLLRALNAS